MHHHGSFVAQEVMIMMLGNAWDFETQIFSHVVRRVESLLTFFVDSHGTENQHEKRMNNAMPKFWSSLDELRRDQEMLSVQYSQLAS